MPVDYNDDKVRDKVRMWTELPRLQGEASALTLNDTSLRNLIDFVRVASDLIDSGYIDPETPASHLWKLSNEGLVSFLDKVVDEDRGLCFVEDDTEPLYALFAALLSIVMYADFLGCQISDIDKLCKDCALDRARSDNEYMTVSADQLELACGIVTELRDRVQLASNGGVEDLVDGSLTALDCFLDGDMDGLYEVVASGNVMDSSGNPFTLSFGIDVGRLQLPEDALHPLLEARAAREREYEEFGSASSGEESDEFEDGNIMRYMEWE